MTTGDNERNPAYDGPMGVFTDYDGCDSKPTRGDNGAKQGEGCKQCGGRCETIDMDTVVICTECQYEEPIKQIANDDLLNAAKDALVALKHAEEACMYYSASVQENLEKAIKQVEGGR